MSWTRSVAALAASLLAPSCGGEPFLATLDSDCGVQLALTGGVEARLAADAMVTCSARAGSEAGIALYFEIAADDDRVERVELSIAAVSRGQTGSDFPAAVVLEIGTERFGSDQCLASIESHDAIAAAPGGERRRVRGAVTCSAPASAEGGAAAAVTIEHFEWAATVVWR